MTDLSPSAVIVADPPTIAERVERTEALFDEIASLWGAPQFRLKNIHGTDPEIFHAAPAEIRVNHVMEGDHRRYFTALTIGRVTLFCAEGAACSAIPAEHRAMPATEAPQ